MSYNFRPLEELNVIDDFLMNAIASDPDVGEPFCRTLLSVLLQRPIGQLKIRVQRVLPALTPEHRGIRLDVEIEEELTDLDTLPSMNLYDMEPHLSKDINYPKHNRFYQAKIDSRFLKRGEKDFRKLPNLYVISITDYDIFGYDYMMYAVHNRCEEVPELEYKDGLYFFYFNTSGSKGGSPEIKAMLNYIQNSTDENVTTRACLKNAFCKMCVTICGRFCPDEGVVAGYGNRIRVKSPAKWGVQIAGMIFQTGSRATRELHQYVEDVKILPEVRQNYMTFEEYVYYRERDARIEGKAEGKTEGKIEAIEEILESYGEGPSETLLQKIHSETNIEVLNLWIKIAAKSSSIAEFCKAAELSVH